eukprot:TRINITY_DN19490_c0_g2_i1.p1 TRINITY_DN19490_c0_g2~~TRINITY_DN19490_c0_g2_i1.p1  ORF type:complete len:960 (-),score=231.57 TRINITY_DN19490_c0_g2_i1:286-3165(-)
MSCMLPPDPLGGESPDDILAEDCSAVDPKSLTISYKEPHTGKTLTEDVFIDPRDSWCVGSGGGTLLVCASAVEALQQRLNKEQATCDDSRSVLNTCRRDYLREHQYLTEELKRLVVEIPLPGVVEELQKILETRLELSEAAAENVDAVATPDEQEVFFEKVYTRQDDDEDLEIYLKKAGFKYSVELSFRMAMREIYKAIGPLLEQRRRLAAIVAALEGPGADLLKALLAAVKEDANCKFQVVLREIFGHCLPDQRTAIETLVTKNLKKRYEDLEVTQRKNEEACLRWRERLRAYEEREAVVCELDHEVRTAESELQAKLAKEEQDVLERRRVHAAKQAEADAEYAKAEAEEEARRAAMPTGPPKEPEPLDPSNFWNKLSREQQNQIRDLEMNCKRGLEEQVMLKRKIKDSENEVNARLARQDRLRGEIGDTEQSYQDLEAEVLLAEMQIREMEEQEREAKDELRDMERKRNKLESEQEARSAPPASPEDLSSLEAELLEAEVRNQELTEECELMKAKEELYDEKVAHARRCLAEQDAAKGRVVKPKAEPKKREPKPKPSDPDLLDYHERIDHPKYKDLERFKQLSTDERAKEKRFRVQRDVATEADEQARLACAQPVVYTKGPASTDGSKVPVNFRRQEDLRVKLAGARRDFKHVASAVDERNQLRQGIQMEMYTLAAEIAGKAERGRWLHDEARQRLEHALTETGSDASNAGVSEHDKLCAERRELLNAMANHQACLSEASEAWALTETLCERGRDEAALESEQRACAQKDDAYVASVEKLYQSAARALVAIDESGESDPLQAPCRRYCREVETATPAAENARAAVAAAWEELLQLARGLDGERVLQGGLESLYRDKDRSRKLLDAELQAPPEARRALAAVRKALAAGSPLRDALRAEDPLWGASPAASARIAEAAREARSVEAAAPQVDLALTPGRAKGYRGASPASEDGGQGQRGR